MSPPELTPLDPEPILATLRKHEVRFVVIGAIAAILQGYPLPTYDLDITPDDAPDNLERLADALRELEAKLRTPQGAIDFPVDAKMLSGARVWTLTTRAGDLDLVFDPAGTAGYADLRRGAIAYDIGSGEIPVASLIDVIRSKETAHRVKDQAQLPALRRTLELRRERESRS